MHTHVKHGVIIVIPYTGDGEKDNLSVVPTDWGSELDECLLSVRVGIRSRFS